MLKQKLTFYIAIISISLNFSNCYSQAVEFATSKDLAVIHFKTFGSGKPLLIINGGPGMNSNGFESLAKTLSLNNLTIIYDQRGTGKSILNILDTTTINMKLMIEDIESIRKQLKLEKWSILGHSFGGIVASYYATIYPQYIDRIILSASGGVDLDLLNYFQSQLNSKLSQTNRDSLSYWTTKINEGDTSYYARLERGKNLAPAYVFDKNFTLPIAERLTQGNALINQLIWLDLAKIKYNCSDKLKTFNQPVLIIQGKDDIIKAETAEKSHQVFPNSYVVLMDHCGHYGWLDNPDVYFKEIYQFLK